jgi:hypothetical protein
MNFARIDCEVDAVQDFCVFNTGVKIFNFEHVAVLLMDTL